LAIRLIAAACLAIDLTERPRTGPSRMLTELPSRLAWCLFAWWWVQVKRHWRLDGRLGRTDATATDGRDLLKGRRFLSPSPGASFAAVPSIVAGGTSSLSTLAAPALYVVVSGVCKRSNAAASSAVVIATDHGAKRMAHKTADTLVARRSAPH
jgi:hypothetical protein